MPARMPKVPAPVLVEVGGFALPDQPEVVPAGDTPLAPTELIRLPARHNPRLRRLLQQGQRRRRSARHLALPEVTAVDRLGMSDHGPVHMQIVANSALRLLRLLVASDVRRPASSRTTAWKWPTPKSSSCWRALLHDSGMSIHRADHEEMSLFIALPKLQELLADLYPPADPPGHHLGDAPRDHHHRSGGRPLTLEAGVVRLADALDMAQGRSRVALRGRARSTSTRVSAAAIDSVHIGPGETKPVRVEIRMNNSAGIFQLDELLKDKLRGSGWNPMSKSPPRSRVPREAAGAGVPHLGAGR